MHDLPKLFSCFCNRLSAIVGAGPEKLQTPGGGDGWKDKGSATKALPGSAGQRAAMHAFNSPQAPQARASRFGVLASSTVGARGLPSRDAISIGDTGDEEIVWVHQLWALLTWTG
jgi:hypothetical protein